MILVKNTQCLYYSLPCYLPTGVIGPMADELPRREQLGINRNLYNRPKGRGIKPLSASGGLVRLRRIKILMKGRLCYFVLFEFFIKGTAADS